MITEKQVVQYLKNKDQDYIDNLLDRIKNYCSSNDKSESKIICPICGLSSVKKMAKIPMKNNVIFVMTVIDLLVKTLKDEAYFMNTSITTCFYMRHKLYKAASQIIQEQKLSDEIEIDSQYLSINLKGTKLENMPRYSKKKRKTISI